MKKLAFAVIGGGPSAFYISKNLARLPSQPIIHIFEKDYCPFGLIRYGVAPDHISIKKSEISLSSISSYPLFQYFGNQQVDQPLLKELKEQYSGIIYAMGAQGNNQPIWMRKRTYQADFESKTILNARDIVYWYNNHPASEKVNFDLKYKRDMVIIGNGNVAIDIARIMLKKPEELIDTQISLNALNSLNESRITNVTLAGRRGFTHSAFSLKQIRELVGCGVKIYYIKEEMTASMNDSSVIECTSVNNDHSSAVRINKRKMEFINQKCHSIKKDQISSILQNGQRKVILRYLIDPVQLISGNLIKMAVTQLNGVPFKQIAEHTNKEEFIHFDLLVNSTGFKVQPIIKGQFNKKSNNILNTQGCVFQSGGKIINIGQYAVGWCKSGPRGVIDDTFVSCEQTFNSIKDHISQNMLIQKSPPFFKRNLNVNFARYLQLKELQLQLGDKSKFIKRKLLYKDLQQFFS